MRLVYVAGARPNFVKVASVMRAGAVRGIEQVLIHTGQHYDVKMSDIFFRDLDLPQPDHLLCVGAGSHAEQTARAMLGLEPLLQREAPDWVIVVGDVNSTVAAALTAAKLGLPLAHVEAGLRSFDRSMPEEVNRVATDALSDLLFTHSADANLHLAREGHPPLAVRLVGNVMIDALERSLPAARRREVPARFDLAPRGYAVLTLHRPANVDDPAALAKLMDILSAVAERLPLVFPVHPRTRERLAWSGAPATPRVRLVEPLGYLDFLALLDGARLVLTDSGGIQEETTALGIPCLTLRPGTERPITITLGTNRIVGTSAALIHASVDEVLAGDWPAGVRPPLWDGRASERIIESLLETKRPPDPMRR